MTKRSVYDLLALRAEFDQDLHEAVLKKDTAYINAYLDFYSGDDREYYNFEEPVDTDRLCLLVIQADKDFERAFKEGSPFMGM